MIDVLTTAATTLASTVLWMTALRRLATMPSCSFLAAPLRSLYAAPWVAFAVGGFALMLYPLFSGPLLRWYDVEVYHTAVAAIVCGAAVYCRIERRGGRGDHGRA